MLRRQCVVKKKLRFIREIIDFWTESLILERNIIDFWTESLISERNLCRSVLIWKSRFAANEIFSQSRLLRETDATYCIYPVVAFTAFFGFSPRLLVFITEEPCEYNQHPSLFLHNFRLYTRRVGHCIK